MTGWTCWRYTRPSRMPCIGHGQEADRHSSRRRLSGGRAIPKETPQGYRDRTEIADGKTRDPIERLQSRLMAEGSLESEQFADMQRAAEAEMDRAVAFAESSPLPAPEEAL